MAQTKPKAGQFYGVSDNGTDGEFLQTDGAGGMAWASTITNPTITSIDYPGITTAADPAGGESVIINGTLFASGITCTVGGTSAVTAFNSATQITITTPAKAAGSYGVIVTNPNGGTASQANFIQYSGIPIWTTAAGNIGSVTEGEAASFQVTATEGSDTIEYAVTTGTLPTGLSLATATGAITGTAPAVSADTTTTFSITATDDENQTSAVRSFNIIVTNDAPSNHFNTVLYTGNGSGSQSINVGFTPDLTWIKGRNSTDYNNLIDSVRTAGCFLSSNTTGSEDCNSSHAVVQTGGFNAKGNPNASGTNYVSWNFKAGGAATTIAANTVGNTIASDVSVNNTLGFSIVNYTGTGSNASVAHGLDAAPELLIVKLTSSAQNWVVYHSGNGASPQNKFLTLNSTVASETYNMWQNTAPTSSVFTISTDGQPNTNNGDYIAYCFTSKAGFSKVGSYTGNGSTSGPIVNTGFEPAFLLIKGSNVSSWLIYDNKRTSSNPRNNVLLANTNSADIITSNVDVNFYSNGFQTKVTQSDLNNNGTTYTYLAFAADGSTATPSLANSFATELYTGNSGTQSITTGFKPDFIWIKTRSNVDSHFLWDTLRGANEMIISNSSGPQYNRTGVTAFNSNGFTLGNYAGVNTSGYTYVSWNWKAGGTPSINTDGSVTSIVSANQAAGFSIVKHTGSMLSANTFGHGLSAAPEIIISKITNTTDSWWIFAPSILGNTNVLELNATAAPRSVGLTYSGNATTFSINWTSGPYDFIHYCFTSIAGYSKVGTYTGLGSGGPLTVNMGFAPTLALIKRTDSTGDWRMFDTVRGTDKSLRANVTDAEYDDIANYVDFTSTGFYFSTSQANPDINAAGGTYIYLAIKEN